MKIGKMRMLETLMLVVALGMTFAALPAKAQDDGSSNPDLDEQAEAYSEGLYGPGGELPGDMNQCMVEVGDWAYCQAMHDNTFPPDSALDEQTGVYSGDPIADAIQKYNEAEASGDANNLFEADEQLQDLVPPPGE